MRKWRTGLTVLTGSLCALAVAGASGVQHAGAAAAAATPIYLDTSYSFQARAADLVSRMTLSEKVAQLHTNNAPAISRLGVQQYTYWSEGQHGINRLGADTAAGGQGAVDNVHATSFPVNLAATMTWDPSLTYQETTAISDEVRGFLDKSLFPGQQNNLGPSAGDYGSLTFWAPTVNLDRDPRWGRTDEAFGEDPLLNGQMAGAFVNGYQGNSQSGTPQTPYLKVAATAKHYALNNVESNRLSGDSVASDADIRNYYTKQFSDLIQNDHVAGLMTSYNAINGTPGAVNTYTVNDLAERTYGFSGYTTSDCDAVDSAWDRAPGGHMWAPPGWTSAVKSNQVVWTNTTTGATIAGAAGGLAYALRAGTQLVCTGDEATLTNVQAAIDAGLLSVGVIDADLTQLFATRMSTGEFDPAANVSYTSINKSVIESSAHQDLARKVADEDMVLLKNDVPSGLSKPLLPVDVGTVHKVVILGNLANVVTLGGYSGQPTHTTSIVQGITAAVHAADPDATITYDAAGTSTKSTAAATLSDATKAAVQAADLVLVVAGTDSQTASEGGDRANIAMPGNYQSLIDQVNTLGNPHTALVLQTDGPVTLAGTPAANVPAIVFSSYNGQAQGSAVADVVFGTQNPEGHLDFTWFKDDSQLPAMQNYGLDADSTGGLGRTYQYFTGTPTYAFGYGLSYSTFSFTNAAVDHSSVTADGTVNVSLDVTNTGSVKGRTVAQLYAAGPGAGTGDVPLERLAGFVKTGDLAPGQTQHVTIPVTVSDLALWDSSAKRMTVADGTWHLRVATDAAHAVATEDVDVTGAWTPKVRYVTVRPESVEYQAGDTIDLTGTNRWLKDDTKASEEPDRDLSNTADAVVEAVDNDQSFADLAHENVTYASSDPSVATVSAAGLVRAVSDGTATITVTVGGVSGTAPIVVGGTLTSAAPPVVPAGAPSTVSASFTNGGGTTEPGVALAIQVPAGWTATPTTPTTVDVPPGQVAKATWRVTPPADAALQGYTIGFTATSGDRSFSSSQTVTIPYASFAAAFDNAGISTDGQAPVGYFDGGGLNFSEQALASAGFVSGNNVTVSGISFHWPNANQLDNIVAGGQAVPFSGKGATLGFLGAGNNGTPSGGGTIVYTDGSTQPFALTFADWWNGSAAAGTSIAASTPYLNSGTGRTTQVVHIYYAGVSIDPAKTVQYVILPNITPNGQVAQVTAMHVFAIGAAQSPAAATVPAAPSGVLATPGAGTADVSWVAPTSDGGSPITGYTVTASPGGATCTATTTHCTVTGLTGGTAYTFTVTAKNVVGTSAASAASVAITPAPPTSTTASTTVGGTVQATLALTLGAPPSFGTFTLGKDQTYSASTTATVSSTAGDATLSVSDPGHLTNGSFSLPDPLQVTLSKSSWSGPVTNDAVAVDLQQHIGANDPLRTGTYSRTLTFTLSTYTP
jgi:beta-glucosidase